MLPLNNPTTVRTRMPSVPSIRIDGIGAWTTRRRDTATSAHAIAPMIAAVSLTVTTST